MVVYAEDAASIAGLSGREVGDNVSNQCQSVGTGAVGVLLQRKVIYGCKARTAAGSRAAHKGEVL